MNQTKVHLGLVFKDFATWVRSSCVGLHVAGYATAKVLQDRGVDVTVFPVRHNIDIADAINQYNASHDEGLTHLVISAPWLTTHDLQALVEAHPEIQFVVLSHSNVGFLQADPDGIYLLRQYALLANQFDNLHVGGNSRKFVEWFSDVYDQNVVLLPNLYPLDDVMISSPWSGGILKIGSFGAVRPYKNFMTSAAAALLIQKKLNVPVEFHMSSGGEGDGYMTVPAIKQLLAGTDVELVIHDWVYWDDFIRVVSDMDLLIQVSYTESFNMITADGISQGVPSVVSPAIYWAPKKWQADPDDVEDVGKIGLNLIADKDASSDGLEALDRHNQYGLKYWVEYLEGQRTSINL